MSERTCNKCFVSSTTDVWIESLCPLCGFDNSGGYAHSSSSTESTKPSIDKESSVGNSSQSAINILGTVNTLNAWCGVVVVLGSFLLWLNQGEDLSLIFFAVAFGVLTLIIWAVNRVFIGIAEDVKGIRQKLEDSN